MRYINENSKNKRVQKPELNKFSYHIDNNYGLKSKESGCAYAQVVHSIAAPATAAVATIVTTRVHFAVDKLGEFGDEVLVIARSKREVENDLHFDRFYERLHKAVSIRDEQLLP
jgi:hypothetical protein